MEPFRLGVTICEKEFPFVYNEEFELMERGTPQFFVNGEVRFPPGREVDGTYRTKFGGASHNATIYGKYDENFRKAMQRLTGKRCPENPGEHESLQALQAEWFARNEEVMALLRSKYARHFEGYTSSEGEAAEHHGDPHQKRVLRVQAFEEITEDNRLTKEDDLWVKSVWWKLKANEYAKPGKKPRGICDLGVAASLRGAWLTNYLKIAQAEEPIELEGGQFVFCKSPDPFQLERHFVNLINPQGRFYFVYFSDDSCLSIRGEDGIVRLYNLDISSCDASHGPAVFQALVGLMPSSQTRRDMEILVAQCKLPLRIISYANKNHVVFLKPKVPKLLSGSTITTAINNLANLAIGLEIVRSYRVAPDNIENPHMVAAARRVGYILTGCQPLRSPHQLQFLKHSPVRDLSGEWRPMLNLGVLVRASMTCDGDLPGRGDFVERAKAFQRGLLQGSYPYTSFDILDDMRVAVGEGRAYEVDVSDKVVKDSGYPHFRVDEEEIMLRYDLSSSEYEGLRDFGRLKVCEFLHNEGLSKVLNLDYGLETTSCGPSPDIYERGCQDEALWCR